jgi:hypothetical protein
VVYVVVMGLFKAVRIIANNAMMAILIPMMVVILNVNEKAINLGVVMKPQMVFVEITVLMV